MLHFEKRLEARKLEGRDFLPAALWIFVALGSGAVYH
jgi:hypothetical protein